MQGCCGSAAMARLAGPSGARLPASVCKTTHRPPSCATPAPTITFSPSPPTQGHPRSIPCHPHPPAEGGGVVQLPTHVQRERLARRVQREGCRQAGNAAVCGAAVGLSMSRPACTWRVERHCQTMVPAAATPHSSAACLFPTPPRLTVHLHQGEVKVQVHLQGKARFLVRAESGRADQAGHACLQCKHIHVIGLSVETHRNTPHPRLHWAHPFTRPPGRRLG